MRIIRQSGWKGLILLLSVIVLLGGCGKLFQRRQTDGESSDFTIYYAKADGTELTGKSYTATAQSFDKLLEELLRAFITAPSSDVRSALPDTVSINGYSVGADSVTLDFSSEYLSLTNVQEILLRAGIVKTIIQLPGVMSVSVTVDGQPVYEDNGAIVHAMNEDTFIDSRGEGINSYNHRNMRLYYATESGDTIGYETREVFYSTNFTLEHVVVDEIIRGPVNETLHAVVSPSVKVINIRVKDEICTVDLSESFIYEYNGGYPLDAEVSLYAFVNTLCEICSLKGVQFEVEGDSNVRFRDQISLQQVFYYDREIIREKDRPALSQDTGGMKHTGGVIQPALQDGSGQENQPQIPSSGEDTGNASLIIPAAAADNLVLHADGDSSGEASAGSGESALDSVLATSVDGATENSASGQNENPDSGYTDPDSQESRTDTGTAAAG